MVIYMKDLYLSTHIIQLHYKIYLNQKIPTTVPQVTEFWIYCYYFHNVPTFWAWKECPFLILACKMQSDLEDVIILNFSVNHALRKMGVTAKYVYFLCVLVSNFSLFFYYNLGDWINIFKKKIVLSPFGLAT